MGVKIVESTREFGIMNANSRFYPMRYDAARREKEFMKHRKKLGEFYGFDPNKFFMADQLDKSGTYFEITEEYVEDNPKGWSDIPEDILVISKDVPGVVIGHPVADCPVVMVSDSRRGVSAIGHCSCELIDKRLPMMVADALVDAYGSYDEDLHIYVSACAGEDWIYQNYPRWAEDYDFWKDCIYEEDGIFKIDIRKALSKQFNDRNIKKENIVYNPADTITDKNYYSNFASSPNGLGDKSKLGRHFAGLFYDNGYQLVKKNKK